MKRPPPPIYYPGDIHTLDDYHTLRTGTRVTDARGVQLLTSPGIPSGWFPMTKGWRQ